jgi:hypothetical protein
VDKRVRLGCNALHLGGERAQNFILSDSGRKTVYWADAPNLVVVVPPGLAQDWRVFVRGVLRLSPGVVFARQLAEAFLRHKVVGAARQAAASVGLLSEKKGLRHRTLTQQGGSPV